MPREPGERLHSRAKKTVSDGKETKAQSASGTSRRSSRGASTIPVSAVIERARDMGLMTSGTKQIGARLPTKLLEQVRRRTGIASTSELLAFALANVAVEDGFAKAFVAARGKVDPDLDIGF